MPRYAISDIHGCPKTFRKLLKEITFSKQDELFLLGDYIDKGPDGIGVINHILELEEQGYNITCLAGNHERMFTNEVMRGEHTGVVPQRYHVDVTRWILGLPYYHETPGYILVHAGLNFKESAPLDAKYDMLWIRNWYGEVDKDWLGDRIIVHGHTPERLDSVKEGIRLMADKQRVCIDSGCALSYHGMGYLTALNLDSQEGHFVKICEH
ncbi:MAG: serine/threonine protein phosphatase 1 [Neolewinella sp.]|jgi:serine/threonine protein phosphatase 1